MIYAKIRGTGAEVEVLAAFDNTDMVVIYHEDMHQDIHIHNLMFSQNGEECIDLSRRLAAKAFEWDNPYEEQSLKLMDHYLRLSRFMVKRAIAKFEAAKFKRIVKVD